MKRLEGELGIHSAQTEEDEIPGKEDSPVPMGRAIRGRSPETTQMDSTPTSLSQENTVTEPKKTEQDTPRTSGTITHIKNT